MGHMFLPPSGAGAWVHCPAWPSMNRDFPQADTPSTIEGTHAHEVFPAMLNGVVPALSDTVTLEMIEGAQMYVRDILTHSQGAPVYVEQRMLAPYIHPLHCGGTPDTFAWVTPNRLVLWDYKFGHDYVSAFQNWQLITYVRAVLDTWQVDSDSIVVDMRLIQPRNYDAEGHIRSWVTTVGELRPFWEILNTAANEATRPNPQARAGTHCKHCPGRHVCKVNQRAASYATKYVGEGQPFMLDGRALGRELRALEDARALIDARITGLQEEAEAKIRRRESVEGYALERTTNGRGNWVIPIAKIQEQGRLFGVDITTPKPLTPKQAVKAGLPEAVAASFSRYALGEEKLVRNEDSHASKIFRRS